VTAPRDAGTHEARRRPRTAFAARLRTSKALAAAELLLAAAIALAAMAGLLPFSGTPFLLAFAWLSLWLRGIGWRSAGLTWPGSWRRALLLGAGGGLLGQVASLYVAEPLIARATGSLPDVSMFAPLVGNTPFLALALATTWTLAAFGLGDRSPAAWVASLVLVSVLFGLGHLYQGTSGAIATGLSSVVFGALYLAGGGNLWVPIVAHGVHDTVGFVLIFLGKYPGM
jgi:membrane protease YdiL (CAAX protease family)